MEVKKESPKTQPDATRNKHTNKETKTKPIRRFELVSKWEPLKLERGFI